MKTSLGRLFFEFVVIVIGVLTAFGLQQLSDSIQEEKQKMRYLNQVKIELAGNLTKIDKLIERNGRQDLATDRLIQNLTEHVQLPDFSDYFEEFLTYGYLTFKLGSYDALKVSSSYNKIENIELTTNLSNLNAQVESTLGFQDQVERLFTELFVLSNNDQVDPITFKPNGGGIYSPTYINNIRQIKKFRKTLTQEFVLIREELEISIQVIDKELQQSN